MHCLTAYVAWPALLGCAAGAIDSSWSFYDLGCGGGRLVRAPAPGWNRPFCSHPRSSVRCRPVARMVKRVAVTSSVPRQVLGAAVCFGFGGKTWPLPCVPAARD